MDGSRSIDGCLRCHCLSFQREARLLLRYPCLATVITVDGRRRWQIGIDCNPCPATTISRDESHWRPTVHRHRRVPEHISLSSTLVTPPPAPLSLYAGWLNAFAPILLTGDNSTHRHSFLDQFLLQHREDMTGLYGPCGADRYSKSAGAAEGHSLNR